MVVKIDELTTDKWANLEVMVKEIWENEHPLIRQVGLLKDSSGIVKFVAWEKSNLPLLEEGATYLLEGLPVSSYESQLSVALVSSTVITRRQSKKEIPTV